MTARVGIAALAFGLVAVASPALAETVFRCGNSYSHAPCAGAAAVDVGASPDAAQRAEARAVALRERQLAAELVREREDRERAMRPAMAGSLSPAPAAPAASEAKKHAHATTKKRRRESDERDFVAVVPSARKR